LPTRDRVLAQAPHKIIESLGPFAPGLSSLAK
jgi:hypothetical protein